MRRFLEGNTLGGPSLFCKALSLTLILGVGTLTGTLPAQQAEETPAAEEKPNVEQKPEAGETPAPGEAPAPAPAPGETKARADAPPDPDRTTFQLPFTAEQGGGKATGSAGAIEYREAGFVVLQGGVELLYQDLKLRAEQVEVDLNTRDLLAFGDVIIDQGPQRITGSEARYNLREGTGVIKSATAYADPDFYFSGDEIAKVGENVYTVENGVFTSCSDEVPDWSFRVRRARIELEGYARIRGASMRVKKMPVFYTPYLLWPAKTERASGLLIPQPGYSQRRGISLSLAYFQTLGRSYDTTFFADLYSRNYLGFGNELRYRPSEGTRGQFSGFAIRDPERNDDWRWKTTLDHTTDHLPFGMRGVINYQRYSDFDYLRDFERDIDRNSIRSILSRGFASGNWGSHSLNILAEDRETIVSGTDTITQQRLPEVEYRLRPTRLGKLPLYLELDSSLAYLAVERSATYDGSYGRVDLFPSLRLPVRAAPWLSLSVAAGYRYTWYGDSLCQQGGTGNAVCGPEGLGFTGETLSRGVPAASAEIVGPSFSRIFEGKVGSFAKFKHVIEPRFTYTFFDQVNEDERDRVPLFDERDTLTSTNVGRWELVNRLLARPAGEGGSAREVLSFRIGQSYSFDPNQPLQRSAETDDPWGPMSATLRWDPGAGTSLQAQVTYNTLFNQLTQQSLTASFRLPASSTVGLTWVTRWRAEDGQTLNDQARLWTSLNLIPKRLRLQAQLNYDIETSELTQHRYILGYTSQCFAINLEAREFKTVERTDRDYRFLLTLKNVGAFLDLSGRQSTADF